MPVLATGIPDLRLELLALPAASKLNVLKLHIRGVLPTLLETLLCWSSANIIQKRAELRAVVAKPREVSISTPETIYSPLIDNAACAGSDIPTDREDENSIGGYPS